MRLLFLLDEGGQDGVMRPKVGLLHLGEGGEDGPMCRWGMV